RDMFLVLITFLCRSLASGCENLIVKNRWRSIAAAGTAPASPRAFCNSRVLMSFGMFPVAGRHGKRRSCQLRERTGNEWSDGATPAFIPGDNARRRLAEAAAARLFRIV